MYDAIVAGLAEAANNDTTLAVITGDGCYGDENVRTNFILSNVISILVK